MAREPVLVGDRADCDLIPAPCGADALRIPQATCPAPNVGAHVVEGGTDEVHAAVRVQTDEAWEACGFRAVLPLPAGRVELGLSNSG